MRARTVAASLGIAACAFGWLMLNHVRQSTNSLRLVSIQQLPEIGEMCLAEPGDETRAVTAASEDENLFSPFRRQPVYAAQDARDRETSVASRPPVRNILDTDPIY